MNVVWGPAWDLEAYRLRCVLNCSLHVCMSLGMKGGFFGSIIKFVALESRKRRVTELMRVQVLG